MQIRANPAHLLYRKTKDLLMQIKCFYYIKHFISEVSESDYLLCISCFKTFKISHRKQLLFSPDHLLQRSISIMSRRVYESTHQKQTASFSSNSKRALIHTFSKTRRPVSPSQITRHFRSQTPLIGLTFRAL